MTGAGGGEQSSRGVPYKPGMRLTQILLPLSGAFFIYVVMAACGGSGTNRGGGSPGAGGATPVPDAFAGTPANVATEPCSTSLEGGDYAVHAYPGLTAQDLAGVQTLCHMPFHESGVPADYPYMLPGLWTVTLVKDGSVAMQCRNSAFNLCDSVTFILPGH